MSRNKSILFLLIVVFSSLTLAYTYTGTCTERNFVFNNNDTIIFNCTFVDYKIDIAASNTKEIIITGGALNNMFVFNLDNTSIKVENVSNGTIEIETTSASKAQLVNTSLSYLNIKADHSFNTTVKNSNLYGLEINTESNQNIFLDNVTITEIDQTSLDLINLTIENSNISEIDLDIVEILNLSNNYIEEIDIKSNDINYTYLDNNTITNFELVVSVDEEDFQLKNTSEITLSNFKFKDSNPTYTNSSYIFKLWNDNYVYNITNVSEEIVLKIITSNSNLTISNLTSGSGNNFFFQNHMTLNITNSNTLIDLLYYTQDSFNLTIIDSDFNNIDITYENTTIINNVNINENSLIEDNGRVINISNTSYNKFIMSFVNNVTILNSNLDHIDIEKSFSIDNTTINKLEVDIDSIDNLTLGISNSEINNTDLRIDNIKDSSLTLDNITFNESLITLKSNNVFNLSYSDSKCNDNCELYLPQNINLFANINNSYISETYFLMSISDDIALTSSQIENFEIESSINSKLTYNKSQINNFEIDMSVINFDILGTNLTVNNFTFDYSNGNVNIDGDLNIINVNYDRYVNLNKTYYFNLVYDDKTCIDSNSFTLYEVNGSNKTSLQTLSFIDGYTNHTMPFNDSFTGYYEINNESFSLDLEKHITRITLDNCSMLEGNIDLEKPNITNLEYRNLTNESKVEINITVTDNFDTNLTCYSSKNTNYTSNTSKLNVTLDEGNNDITILCKDDFNNTDSKQISIIKDTTGPVFNIGYSGINYINESFSYDFLVIDDWSENSTCVLSSNENKTTYTLVGQKYEPTTVISASVIESNVLNNTNFAETLPLENGLFEVTIKCTDHLGNSNEYNHTIFYDEQEPFINNITHDNTSYKNSNPYEINYELAELTPDKIEVYLNNTLYLQESLVSSTGTLELYNLSTGIHNITLVFFDKLGLNGTKDNIVAKIDIDKPILNLSLYKNNTNEILLSSKTEPYNETSFYFILNTTDFHSNLKEIKINFDGNLVYSNSTINNNTANINKTVENITMQGKHSLQVLIVDMANNTNEIINYIYTTGVVNTTYVKENIESRVNISNFTIIMDNTIVDNDSAIINETINISFKANVSDIDFQITLENIDALEINWNEDFNITENKTEIESSIYEKGANTTKVLTIKNINDFVGEDYDATVKISNISKIFDTTNYEEIGTKYLIYHCLDNSSCYDVNQCLDNNISNFNGVDSCYMNQSLNYSIKVPHFSSIVFATDDVLLLPTILSPEADYKSSKVTVSLSFYESVTGNITISGYNISTPNKFEFSTDANNVYTRDLNESGNAIGNFAFKNGEYNITINFTDRAGKNLEINHTFIVNDTSSPTQDFIVDGRSRNSDRDYCEDEERFDFDEIYFQANSEPVNISFNYTDEDGEAHYFSSINVFEDYFFVNNGNSIDDDMGEDRLYDGEYQIWNISYCNAEDMCDTKVINISCIKSKDDDEDDEGDSASSSGGGSTSVPSTTTKVSTQSKITNDITTTLSTAQSLKDQGAPEVMIVSRLDNAHKKQQELFDLVDSQLKTLKALEYFDFDSLGIKSSDFINAQKDLTYAKRDHSKAKVSDLDDRMNKINNVLKKQINIINKIPEVEKTNTFKNNIEVNKNKLDTAKSKALEEKAKTSIESIDYSDNKFTTTKNLDVYEISNKEVTDKKIDLTTIKILLKPRKNYDKISFIEVIPKEMAKSASEIKFKTKPTRILQDDPIVEWDFTNLKQNKIKELSYTITKKVKKDTTTSIFGVKKSIEESLVETTKNESNTLNEKIAEASSNETITKTSMNENKTSISWENIKPYFTIGIFSTIMVLAIISLFVATRRNKSKHKKVPKEKHKKVTQKPMTEKHTLLVNVITEGLKSGLTMGQIKEELEKKGWPKHIIDHTLDNMAFDKKTKYKLYEK